MSKYEKFLTNLGLRFKHWL